MKATESVVEKFDVLSTGLSAFDAVLGVGGIPSKKIVELSGIWSVGKSTLALQAVAAAQKKKQPCLYADIEFVFSVQYAESLGVNCEELDFIQTKFAEDVMNDIETWALENKDGLIVIDGVGQLLTREEAEKVAGERVIGGQARLISSFCRKIVPIIALQNHMLLILNHQFTDLMTGRLKTAGGAKLEYARSIWVTMRKLKPMTGGVVIECEVRKNKVAPTEKKKAELVMYYGKGFVNEKIERKSKKPSGSDALSAVNNA